MANVILKFERNKRSDGKAQLLGFFRKRVHFIHSSSKEDVKPGEYWECFVWDKRPKFDLVKPFRKIDPEKIKEHIWRVASFNKELRKIEDLKNDDFERVHFDKDNTPYLQSKLSKEETEKKYGNLDVSVKDDKVLARPKKTE